MIADRHRVFPQRSGNAAAGYVLAMRQLTGVFFILFFFAMAWLLAHLPLPPLYTPVAGYGIGLALFVPGALLATRGRMCGKTLLGGGAAFVFLTTMTLFKTSQPVLPFQFPLYPYSTLLVCAALLALFAALAWRANSQSNSLLTIALAIYMLYTISPQLSTLMRGLFLFIGAASLVIWLCLWATCRSGQLFTHFALFLGYGAIYNFGRAFGDVGGIPLGLVAAALILLYAAMTALVAGQTLRNHTRHHILLFFAVANTLLYIAAGVLLFASDHVGYLWLITGAAFASAAIAASALYVMHGDDALLSFYAATAVVALLGSLLPPLTQGARLAMLTTGCLAPALLSHRRNDRLLRLTEYGLLGVAFVVSFFPDIRAGHALLVPVGVPAPWVWLPAAVALLCMMTCLHAHWIFDSHEKSAAKTVGCPGYHPEQELLALTCAFTAALMTTIHTILLRGDSEALPTILSAQGMVFLGLGMTLSTPALALAGLAPIFAGHALFHAFPYLAASAAWMPANVPVAQVIALSTATLALALYADCLLRTRLGENISLKEKALAAIPYLPALALLLPAAHEAIPTHYLPALLGGAATALLLPLWLGRRGLSGMEALGIVLAAISIAVFIRAARGDALPAYALPWHLPLLGAYVVSLVFMERIAAYRAMLTGQSPVFVSYPLAGFVAAVGAIGLYRWNSGSVYFPALLGFALLLAYFGRICRIRPYYHVALALFAVGFILLVAGT